MKRMECTLLLLLLAVSNTLFSQDNVGIGTTTPNASAIVDINPPDKNKGLLIPRLSTVERDAINQPAESLLIFNTDSQCYEGYSTQKSQWFSFSCLLEEDFTCGKEFTDIRDNNAYKTVQIGNQCWMAENLRFLPDVGSGKYVYNYTGTDVEEAKLLPDYVIYGVLYNWATIVQGGGSSTSNPSGVRGVCPEGWHVPSDAEWCEMENFVELGLDEDCDKTAWRGVSAGKELKDNNSWNGTTNPYGFTGLAGGSRSASGTSFNNITQRGDWWTATEGGANAIYRSLHSNEDGVNRFTFSKNAGMSLRCVLD